jgi:hypothetical protein
MGAVTYPDSKVIEFLNGRMISVQLLFDAQPCAADFTIKWTPTMITLDEAGKEHHRIVGFLGPEDFIATELLGIAKTNFDRDKFAEALSDLDKILTTFPKSKAAPEAIYLKGVCGYKSTHDPKPLKAAWEKLKAEYPTSDWTERAQPYSLLP